MKRRELRQNGRNWYEKCFLKCVCLSLISLKGVKRILAVINQCFVFKIPPQVSAAGHRADSWPKEPVWTGRLTIFSCDEDLMIELRDSSNGSLFAACPMKRNGPTAVQKGLRLCDKERCRTHLHLTTVVDSSRYFVLRVVDQNSGRKPSYLQRAYHLWFISRSSRIHRYCI